MRCEPIDLRMFRMARLYAWDCTKQQEKFNDFYLRGCPWAWEDCAAAHTLLQEHYGRDYLGIHDDFREVDAYHATYWLDREGDV